MNQASRAYLPVLISACLLLVLSFGYRAGFGLFMQPMSQANGWGRDVLALALAIQNLSWGICAVIAGGLADRYGNLRVLLSGVLLYGLGMYFMASSTTELQVISTAGLIVGAGVAGTSFGIVLPAIARAVPEERRGWALGMGTAAGSMGQFLVVPLIQLVVDSVGWFQALQFLGVSAFLMALFTIPLARYGGPQNEADDAQVRASLARIAGNAFQVRSYTLLVFGFFVCGFHVAFITVHMPGYVVDLGFPAAIGAWSISLIGLCNVFGSYYSGTLCGQRPMHRLLAFIYLARAVIIAIFLMAPTTIPGILLFSAAMGFLWLATVPPTSGLVALFFGTRYMTFLYGIVFLSHQLGSFSGVWLGGWLYERTGNYDGIWMAGIVLGILAALLHWPIREQDYSAHLQKGAGP
ncbi:MAG: MFS transporter [Gammaproteobacteria bacterium]|nr:MFS transporter [Pseudomonadales bacterium]